MAVSRCGGGRVSAGRALAAVRAAGVGGGGGAGEGQHGGEADLAGRKAGGGGGAGGEPRDHVVREQQRGLAGEFRRASAQDAAGAADGEFFR